MEGITGADLQFLVDSKWKAEMDHHQFELLCLTILNAAYVSRNGIPSASIMSDRVADIYKLFTNIQQNKLINDLLPKSKKSEF
jgi:hypothetical protein